MSEKALENNDLTNETADNMAEGGAENEEALGRELNTDDSSSEVSHQLIEEESELEILQAQVDEAKDKYLRLAAEFDNFRRRTAKERVELINTAGQEVLKSMLVVLDDLDRASEQMEKATEIGALKEGVDLVFNKMKSLMQQKGIKEMECLHHPFDSHLHEAITEIPAPSEDMVGKIIAVVEKGYYLNDKLIRHAKVVVGK